jgi:hypothetical protein
MKRKKISIEVDDLRTWECAAVDLGYGERGKMKLLRVMLSVAIETPSLFRKR